MSHDASAIYLLGDIFDFWYEYFWKDRSKRQFEAVFRTIRRIVKQGIEVHFFTGNHDMWMFDYLERECGAIMHDDPVVMELCGKRCLIGHGDGLGHLDHSYDFLRRIFRSLYWFSPGR